MSPQKQVDESTSLERDFRQAVSSLKLTFRQRMPIQEYAKQDLAAIQTSPVGDIACVIRSSWYRGTSRGAPITATFQPHDPGNIAGILQHLRR
jgi:hypothetical protein